MMPAMTGRPLEMVFSMSGIVGFWMMVTASSGSL